MPISSCSASAKKIVLRDATLHAKALQYFESHRNDTNCPDFAKLAQLLEKRGNLEAEKSLDCSELSTMKDLIANLYYETLRNFKGIIAATPCAAGNYHIRTAISPKIVYIDEAARMHESEALSLVAFFDACVYIFTGDVFQLPPYTSISPPSLGSNPFKEQTAMSLIERALKSGAVTKLLYINHRQFAGLYELPSRLFYASQMMTGHSGQNGWSPAAKEMHKFLERVVDSTVNNDDGDGRRKNLSNRSNRLVVDIRTSREALKPGSKSYTNAAHCAWILDNVVKLVKFPNLTSSENSQGRPTILILPLYAAQVELIQKEILVRQKAGTLPAEFSSHAKVRELTSHVRTLDSSQGYTADITYVDLVRTTRPGFVSDLHRLCLALTRSRLAEIVLMNAGIFLNSEDEVGHSLAYIYDYVRGRDGVVLPRCCYHCQTFDHSIEKCTKVPPEEKQRCEFCSEEGHIELACPTAYCKNCDGSGHTAKHCPKELRCRRCNELGHLKASCGANRQVHHLRLV
jgi:hypothetical protein